MNIITISILYVLSLYFFGLNAQDFDTTKVKVVFLTQDVADGYDHAGCTPNMIGQLESYFEKQYHSNYIRYDIPKLLKENIEPYYIFNKKYCKPLEKTLGANTFVMTRLELINRGKKPCLADNTACL